MDIKPEPSRGVPCQGPSWKTDESARPCPDLRTQKATDLPATQGFVCIGGAAAIPSTTTITNTRVLPHKDSTQHPSHQVSIVSQPYTQEVLWHLPLCGQPLLDVACLLSTNYLNQYYPMRATTNNTHAPTASPPTTNTNSPFPRSHSHQPPPHHCSCSCCLRVTSPLYITTFFSFSRLFSVPDDTIVHAANRHMYDWELHCRQNIVPS